MGTEASFCLNNYINYAVHTFVECGEFMLISPCLERLPTKFHK